MEHLKSLAEKKKYFRIKALECRGSLARETATQNSKMIVTWILQSKALMEYSSVLMYISAKPNEVETRVLAKKLLILEKGVWVPICGAERGIMSWSRMLSLDVLEPSRFGLYEPSTEHRTNEPPPTNCLCLVPGVAFDRMGNRLGLGGGYFDRFLAAFQGVSFGLAHGIQVLDRIPVGPQDQPVDYLVTEDGIIDCRKLRAESLSRY
jgi:5-formyltetrahydrofolate cyclo-ligase